MVFASVVPWGSRRFAAVAATRGAEISCSLGIRGDSARERLGRDARRGAWVPERQGDIEGQAALDTPDCVRAASAAKRIQLAGR